MERNKAMRVVGRLADRSPDILRYVAAKNMPFLCVEAAVSVVDCFCSYYRLQNERRRTAALAENLRQRKEKLEEANSAYESQTEAILAREEELAAIRLEELKAALEEDARRYALDIEYARANAAARAETVARKNELAVRMSGVMGEIRDGLNGAIARAKEAGNAEVPEDLMEKYRKFLKAYVNFARQQIDS